MNYLRKLLIYGMTYSERGFTNYKIGAVEIYYMTGDLVKVGEKKFLKRVGNSGCI